MSANVRLQAVQSALSDKGVKDVKFLFAPGFTGLPCTEVMSKVADILDVYLAGQFTVVDGLGDRPVSAAA